MPYVRQVERNAVDTHLEEMFPSIQHCGQLNYCVTKLMHLWLQGTGVKYARINEVIGVLECAKLELYRMIAAPYEYTKITENGHITELDK
jgi:hypothetical protein